MPDATWRVYLREWLTVYTADVTGSDGRDECQRHFWSKYRGRVRGEDVMYVNTQYPQLQLRLPNLKGEFKDEADARWSFTVHAGQEEAPRVVQCGSPQEQALLEYGVKMMKS